MARTPAAVRTGRSPWCSKWGAWCAVVVRQGGPQLDAVQPVARGPEAVLGVRDAPPGRHDVQLAGVHELAAADAVAVLDVAVQQPGDGLQADVRVRRHVHAHGLRRGVGRTEVVDEAPGPDRPDLAVGQRAAHEHGAGPSQGHLARLEQGEPLPAVVLQLDLVGVRLEVAHRSTVRLRESSQSVRRRSVAAPAASRAITNASTTAMSRATSAPPCGSEVIVRIASTA